MQIQLNTDNVIRGSETLGRDVDAIVHDALSRFSQDLTRVEVHLNDVNSHKGGETDIRCMLEARLSGRDPVAVTEHAADIEQAVRRASGKMQRALDTVIGRRQEIQRDKPAVDPMA